MKLPSLQRKDVHRDTQQALFGWRHHWQLDFGRGVAQHSDDIRSAMQFRQDRGPLGRVGQRHGSIDRYNTHGDVSCFAQPLEIDSVERMDCQPGGLHDDQAKKQHRRGPRGEAVREDAKLHGRSVVRRRARSGLKPAPPSLPGRIRRHGPS